jgi:hypothetical protein
VKRRLLYAALLGYAIGRTYSVERARMEGYLEAWTTAHKILIEARR